MTDCEMLELAARAGGLDVWIDENGTPWIDGDKKIWNPLRSDGDALRLAVDLKIKINVAVGNGYAAAQVDGVVFVSEPTRKDPYAATRRAITRAAAEIGKAMP